MFEWTPLVQGTALFAVISAAVFLSMRLYGGVWRYASVNDLMAITRAVTLLGRAQIHDVVLATSVTRAFSAGTPLRRLD